MVVNDPRFICDVLIKQSAEFAGRPHSYRMKLTSMNYGEFAFSDTGPEHKGRRKAVQKCMKQYGSGIQRIEDITQTATDDLIKTLVDQCETPIDPHDALCNCVTDVIAILLIGDTISLEKIKEIKDVMDKYMEMIGPGPGIFLDWFPFLRFFGNRTYKAILKEVDIQCVIIGEWMKQRPAAGFINAVQSMSENEKKISFLDSEISQIATSWAIFASGMMTTTTSLTTLMNVLSHYPDVQQKLQEEVKDVIGTTRHPTLKDQDNMPYLRAAILEIGRFASITPLAVHKAVKTCQLDKYTIPKMTDVLVNLWNLHHDEKLWDEPFAFKPERFLDVDGQLVPADHPNRKNTMPFGAGHRVCVGEVLALSRMFLITARILQNFTILPESTVEKQPSCDPRDMKMGITLLPPAYKIRLIPVSD